MYKCKVRIIPYVMKCDGCVTHFHRNHVKLLNLSKSTETYIQSKVLKKTLESISFEYRQGVLAIRGEDESLEGCVMLRHNTRRDQDFNILILVKKI
jgi:hypothetical protein